jgi:hypothetical protein
MGFKIETVHAYIATDEKGDEGIIGQVFGDTFMPFVAADEARIVSLYDHAEAIAKATGYPIILAKFTIRTDMTTIQP